MLLSSAYEIKAQHDSWSEKFSLLNNESKCKYCSIGSGNCGELYEKFALCKDVDTEYLALQLYCSCLQIKIMS